MLVKRFTVNSVSETTGSLHCLTRECDITLLSVRRARPIARIPRRRHRRPRDEIVRVGRKDVGESACNAG